MMHDAHVKLNPLLTWHKQYSKEEDSFQQWIRLKFRKKLLKCTFWA